jgi:hypothetical protein
MRIFIFSVVAAFGLLAAACTSVTLKPADFAWPTEIVMEVDDDGKVFEKRYQTEFNVNPLFFAEFEDSSGTAGKEVHVLRDHNGYYYMVAADFRNVHVFLPIEGGFEQAAAIPVKTEEQSPLKDPYFNWNKERKVVELGDVMDESFSATLNHEGVK